MRVLTFILLWVPLTVLADEAIVAVATNFNPVLEQLRDEFESVTDHEVEISSGSTGKLYAQILHGAPYDIFLAADRERPGLLEQSGFGVAGSRFTYANGHLALWSHDEALILDDISETMLQAAVRRVAIANPSLAPYGTAAQEALRSLGVLDEVAGKLVMGENIGQAFSMVATQNADIGMVALSHVLLMQQRLPGGHLRIPAEFHMPIRQDAILLAHGAENIAALEFMNFLKSKPARARIASVGYGTE